MGLFGPRQQRVIWELIYGRPDLLHGAAARRPPGLPGGALGAQAGVRDRPGSTEWLAGHTADTLLSSQ